MTRRFQVPKATVDHSTEEYVEYLVQWPGKPGHTWGKTYRARKRRNPGTVELFTAARRQPVRIVQRNRLIDAVNAAIYNAECEARK